MSSRRALANRGDLIPALGVVAPPPIQVHSATFQGSLATLFECVRDRKIDLNEIPIFPICEAYFLYLVKLTDADLESAATALHALSYLLERKAFLLLPVPELVPEEPEAASAFEAPTVELYSSTIETLLGWRSERSQLFFRSAETNPVQCQLPFEVTNLTLGDLARAFERILKRAEPVTMPETGRNLRSLEEQMRIVHARLSGVLQSLGELIPTPFSREEAVYWFLALLELIRLGRVSASLRDDGDVGFLGSAPA
jgi:segregation and condensation protein A